MHRSDDVEKIYPFGALTEAMFMGFNLSKLASRGAGAASVPVVHVKDIDEDVLADRDRLERVAIPKEKLGRQELRRGDILVSARGTLLKCAVIGASHEGCVASGNFIVVRTGPSSPVRPELLCAFLRQAETQALLLSRVSSTAQPALTIRDLESLSLFVPAPDKQDMLVRLIRASEDLYRTAIDLARLRRDDALAILAEHMGTSNVEG